VEKGTDLGTAKDEIPAVQHHDTDLLLYRKVFRSLVRPESLDCRFKRRRDSEHVVEKEEKD